VAPADTTGSDGIDPTVIRTAASTDIVVERSRVTARRASDAARSQIGTCAVTVVGGGGGPVRRRGMVKRDRVREITGVLSCRLSLL